MSVDKLYLVFVDKEIDMYAYGCDWYLLGVYTSLEAAEAGVYRYSEKYWENDGSRGIYEYGESWHIDEVSSDEFDTELYRGVGSYYE